MGKRVIVPIVIMMLIAGVLIFGFIKNFDSFNIKEDNIVSMKYYISKENHGNYHVISDELKQDNIVDLVNLLNNSDIKEKIDAPTDTSNRRLYIFLKNNDVIIINNNSVDENNYVIEYPNNSLLRRSKSSNYAVVNSEDLKNLFINIENSLNGVNDLDGKMRI